MKDKKETMYIIIPIAVALFILISSLVFVSVHGTSVISKFMESKNKVEKDATDIDWSSFKAYDVDLSQGSVNITQPGVYFISGTLENGSINVATNNYVKLVLKDANITTKTTPAIYVRQAKATYIELEGESTLNANAPLALDAAIYSKDDLYMLGEGKLNLTSNLDGITSKDNLFLLSGTYNITSKKDGIKAKDSIIIKDGEYTINAEEGGIKTTNIDEYGDILIEKGTFKIQSKLDGIEAQSSLKIKDGKYTIIAGPAEDVELSQKGLKAVEEIVLEKGEYNISSTDDSIHSDGSIQVQDGVFSISSDDDGIHAENDVNIKGGQIKITKCYEGIEGYNITIEAGDINIIASDDGINIGGGTTTDPNAKQPGMDEDNGGLLTIAGGVLYVNAQGDGLDSNGSIKMTAGKVRVDGPTTGGNGLIDYNGSFTITGGDLIAVGTRDMGQNVSESSTQNTVLIYLEKTTSGPLTLGDIQYTPRESYQAVLISSPSLKLNTPYTLTAGSLTQNITLTKKIATVGYGGMMPSTPGGPRPKR